MAVHVFDIGPDNIFPRWIEQWKRNPPSVEGFTEWGPHYSPGCTIQHFFKNDPLRSQLWKIWCHELRLQDLTHHEDNGKLVKTSDELLYSVFGSKEAFREAWEGWLAEVELSTVADRQWYRNGNALGIRLGNDGYACATFALPPGDKPVRNALVMDYMPPKPSPLIGPVKRGVDEPSVGCLIEIDRGHSEEGRLGLGLGVDPGAVQKDAKILKILVEGGRRLVFDGESLKLGRQSIDLPAALAEAENSRLGLTVRIGSKQVTAVVRNEETSFEGTLPINDATHELVLSQAICLVAENAAQGELTPYFDDGRPAYEEYLKPAPANRWRNPGDAEFGWVTKACWRLGDQAPKALVELRDRMHRSADKATDVQNNALADFQKGMPEMADLVAAVSSPKKAQALADLSGCGLTATWASESTNDSAAIVAVLENPGASPIQAKLTFTVDDRKVVHIAQAKQSVSVAPHGEARIREDFKRVSDDVIGFTVHIRADVTWNGQPLTLKERIADRPWPQLTMNVEPLIEVTGDTATVNTEIYSDDNWPAIGKLAYHVTPEGAVKSPKAEVKFEIPAHQRRAIKQSFTLIDKTKPVTVRVVGDVLLDDEEMRFTQEAKQEK